MTPTSKKERCKSALSGAVEELERELKVGKLSIKDFESIGIAGELKKIQQLNARFSAEKILEEIRKPDFDHDFDEAVEIIKLWLSKANIGLEDIGTSKKEIKKLRKRYMEQ